MSPNISFAVILSTVLAHLIRKLFANRMNTRSFLKLKAPLKNLSGLRPQTFELPSFVLTSNSPSDPDPVSTCLGKRTDREEDSEEIGPRLKKRRISSKSFTNKQIQGYYENSNEKGGNGRFLLIDNVQQKKNHVALNTMVKTELIVIFPEFKTEIESFDFNYHNINSVIVEISDAMFNHIDSSNITTITHKSKTWNLVGDSVVFYMLLCFFSFVKYV